jgi:hypothetical protein
MLPERTDDDVSADAMSETAPVVEAFGAPLSETDSLASVTEVPAAAAEEPIAAPVELVEAAAEELVDEPPLEAEAEPEAAEAVAPEIEESAESLQAEEVVAETPAATAAVQAMVAPAADEPDDPHHWDGPSVPFVPHHALLEGMMALAFLTVMLGMIAYMPAPLEERANPYLSPAGVLPEWYLLPPFELLHLVPPLPGMLGTGAAVMVLMFWPFIDRKPRRISRRPFMMIFSLLIIASLIGLSVYSVLKVAAE